MNEIEDVYDDFLEDFNSDSNSKSKNLPTPSKKPKPVIKLSDLDLAKPPYQQESLLAKRERESHLLLH